MLYDRQSQAQWRGHYQNKWLKMIQHSENVRPNLAIIFSQVAYFDNVFRLGFTLHLWIFCLVLGVPFNGTLRANQAWRKCMVTSIAYNVIHV
jgi:hypothetical protein